jgi:hypothetical protein
MPSAKARNMRFCKSCKAKYDKVYAVKYKAKRVLVMREYRARNRDRLNVQTNELRRKIKIEVLSHYSGTNPPQCVNPFGEHLTPYVNLDALSIDHINGCGKLHRKEVKRDFYVWLKKNNYPEGYQVLCMNCQFIKKIKDQECQRKYMSETNKNIYKYKHCQVK